MSSQKDKQRASGAAQGAKTPEPKKKQEKKVIQTGAQASAVIPPPVPAKPAEPAVPAKPAEPAVAEGGKPHTGDPAVNGNQNKAPPLDHKAQHPEPVLSDDDDGGQQEKPQGGSDDDRRRPRKPQGTSDDDHVQQDDDDQEDGSQYEDNRDQDNGQYPSEDEGYRPGLGLHKGAQEAEDHKVAQEAGGWFTQGPEDWINNVGFSAEDQKLLRKKQIDELLKEKITNYKWGQDVINTFTFPDMQKAKPLKGKQRAEVLKLTPDLSTACPCQGLKGMGEEEVDLSSPDRWFCDTAAPQLHRNMLEEMSLLAWIMQEASNPAVAQDPPGSRVGLTEEGIFILLRKLVALKMDTLSLLASMQITRVRATIGRVTKDKKDSERTKPIISAETMEEEDKQEEKKAQKSRQRRNFGNFGFASARRGGARRGGGGPRRHRQASRFLSRPSFQIQEENPRGFSYNQRFNSNTYNQRQSARPASQGRPASFQPARRPFQSTYNRGGRGPVQKGRPSSRGRPRPY